MEPISIRLRRHRLGCLVNVRTSPEVEDFFNRLGGGMTTGASEFGTRWRNPDGQDFPQVYEFLDNSPEFRAFYFQNSGDKLILQSNHTGRDTANLAVLRLVGTSLGEGASFVYDGIFDDEALQRFSGVFVGAAEQFYRNHIRPYNVTISLRDQ